MRRAYAALKEHEDWLNDRANATLVSPDDPGKAKAPVRLGATAAAMLTATNTKHSEKSLSRLVYARRRAELEAPYEGVESPYDGVGRLTDEDRRRIESCSGMIGHEFLGMPPRSARIGTNPPRLPGPEFRRLLQFRMGLPMDRETERGRECRCGLTGDAYGHHSVQCKHGLERKKRHNQPTRILSLMAKRIGCGAHVEQQVYGRVQKPPKGVKNTYTADIVIDDCYGIGQQLVGDVTFAHPNNPSVYVARSEQRAVRLRAAARAEDAKRVKVSNFLEARRAECGYVPPPEMAFVPLAVETYGAVSEEFSRLFNWLVGQWGAVHSATPSQVAIYRHEMKYRMSMAVQLENAEALRDWAGGGTKLVPGYLS